MSDISTDAAFCYLDRRTRKRLAIFQRRARHLEERIAKARLVGRDTSYDEAEAAALRDQIAEYAR